jgi:hypothetical protein
MAIPLYTIIVGGINNEIDGKCRIKSLEASLEPSNYIEFSINDLSRSEKMFKWSNYIKGVIANFKGRLKIIRIFNNF